MTIEDQVAALFARANPVPSSDLLDPIEPLDMEHLASLSERSSVMTDIKTVQPKEEGRPKTRWAVGLAIALLGIVVAVILVNLVNREGGVASPESVAIAFLAAANTHDIDEVTELLAAESDLADVEMAAAEAEWANDEAMGWALTTEGCEASSTVDDTTQVVCSTLLETNMSRALGLEPGIGTATINVKEGKVLSAVFELDDPRGAGEAWDIFRTWIEENHPDDITTMYDPGGGVYLTPQSNALWEQYTDEFAASLEG